MDPSGSIEREFGVPFAGKILPESQWARSALKSMPPGHLDWADLFGRAAPVVLDLGCGNGRFTLQSAVQHPDWNHLAIDTLPVVIRYARRRANQRGMHHVRIAVGGARELLETHIAPHSVREAHVYHPQPYYDPAQVHKRLVTPHFLALAHRALEPGGLFVIQTDNPGYWRYIQAVAPHFFEWNERIGRWPDAPKGRTRREIVAMRKRLPVFRATGTPRPELDLDAVTRLAESLPPPTFDADRRLRDLDRIA